MLVAARAPFPQVHSLEYLLDLVERGGIVAGRARLRPLLNRVEEQLLIVDLEAASEPLVEGIEALGRAYEPPVRTLVV